MGGNSGGGYVCGLVGFGVKTQMEIEPEKHYGVGPYTDVYGHENVTTVNNPGHERAFVLCLDCGYLVDDIRLLQFEECGREDNPINQTWAERGIE
jgi:hypothetical protein